MHKTTVTIQKKTRNKLEELRIDYQFKLKKKITLDQMIDILIINSKIEK